MTTIKLKVNDKVLGKLLWLLSQFKKDEIQVISKLSEFEMNKKIVQADYQKLISGKSKLHSLEDIEKELDGILAQYEA